MTSFDAGIAALNKANELATTKPSCIHRQDNTTNSNLLHQLIQTGWGFIQGNDTTAMGETITFPVAYDSLPIVLINFLGAKNDSAPADIGELTLGLSGGYTIAATTITVSNFYVDMKGTANFNSVSRYGYSWIAIGTKGQ